jgi:hypothetical protein
MFRLYDFRCTNDECQHVEEKIVENRTDIPCPICNSPMQVSIVENAPASWINSRERTLAQLKKRSSDHTRRCKEKGIPLDANDTQISSDPVWRNKTRAKNTSRTTIADHANDHIHWKKDNQRMKKQGLAD